MPFKGVCRLLGWLLRVLPGSRNRTVGQHAREGLLRLVFIDDLASQCLWAARGAPNPRNHHAGQYAKDASTGLIFISEARLDQTDIV